MDKQEPKLVGSVTVILLEGGRIGVNVVGGLSQLQALGLLTAGQHIVTTSAPKDQNMIVPGGNIPDRLLRGNNKGQG